MNILARVHKLEKYRRQIGQRLMLLAMVACIAAWLINPHPELMDTIFLPSLAVLLAVCAVLAWKSWGDLRIIELVLFSGFAAYQLAILLEYSWKGLLFEFGFSSSAMWFPVQFVLAYLFLPSGLARRFSAVVYVLSIMAGSAGLFSGHADIFFNQTIKSSLLNSILQFYLVCPIYWLLIDIYARYQEEFNSMQRLALTDPLTGLANRRRMQEHLEDALKKENFALLLMDLDHFKQINDHYGHAVGDEVLVEVASRLSRSLRNDDIVARWGGEEFLLFAPKIPDTQAGQMAERILHTIQSEPIGGRIPVTLSIGVALYQEGDTLDTLLARADQAMYRAKFSGRNQVAY